MQDIILKNENHFLLWKKRKFLYWPILLLQAGLGKKKHTVYKGPP